MSQLYSQPFRPIDSTAPSVTLTASAGVSTGIAIQATGREWAVAGGRSLRFSEKGGFDYHIQMASASSLAVANSTATMGLLGGTVEIISPVKPSWTHISVYSSTDVSVNMTLGYGQ